MALIDTLRQKYPDYSDDEILGALKATKYPDYSIDEIGKAVGYNPSDLGRGFKESFQQLPQLGYGALAGIGAAGETMLGEGGIMSGLKRAGVQGFQDWGDKIASGARESDSFSYSYDQAKEGNFGALVDWLQHGLGYVGGQGLQALASAGIGAVGGKMALGAAAQQIAKGMVLKEAAVIGATAEGKALAKDALIAQATQNVASKLGQTAAVGALAVGQEGGEIFGDLASQSVKEGRTLTGDELAKAFGATLAAGGLEFVGDKLGLDIIMGKSRIGNKLMGMAGEAPGLGGKLARGAMAGAAAVPAEAGTEYFQTGIEEFGKGTEASPLPWQQSPENQTQAFDAAALGAIGGGAIGAGGGLMSRATQIADAPDPVEATQRLATAGTVDEMVKAANDIAMAPLTPAVRPRQANESTINEIRSLGDPALEQEALGLMATAASRSAAPGVRRYAQNRLDEILLPVRQVPVGEATEMLPTGEATEVQSPAEAEATAQANIAKWLARSQPMDEARANALVEQAQARGMDMTVIPHGAEGFTVVPSGWLAPRQRIPVGEAADMIQAGDATEITPENIELGQIPGGEATDVGPEGGQPLDRFGAAADAQAPTIQPSDLLTADSQPYGTRAGAAVRAKREGGGAVVEVPGGYVVRKESPGEPVSNVAEPAAVPSGPADGRGADAGRGVRNVGSDADASGGMGAAAAAPVHGSGAAVPVGERAGAGDSLTGLNAQWQAAVQRGDSAGARAINDRIVALKAQAAAPPAAPTLKERVEAKKAGAGDLVKVKTVFGNNTYVRLSDIEGPPGLIRMFTAEGKSNGRIQRENLDPTGEKLAASAAEDAANPLFNIITRKGGAPFATKTAAAREMDARGLRGTHEVAPASTVRAGVEGFIVRRKDAATPPDVAATPPGPIGEPSPVDTSNPGAGVAKAPEAAATDDPFAALFGTPEQQAESQRRHMETLAAESRGKEVERAAVERVRSAIADEKKRATAEHGDWAGKVYKANKTQVELRGDGPSRNPSMSIGAINESRRRNAMEALTQEMRALDRLEAAITEDSGKVMANLRDLMQKAERAVASGNWPNDTADSMFQSMLLDDLKFRGPGGKGNVTSNGLSKAMLAALKGEAAPAQPAPLKQRLQAMKERGRATEPETPAARDTLQDTPVSGVAAPREAFEHAGLKVYPGRVRVGDKVEDRWAVQLPENKATGKVLGDTLHATREEAMTAAEREVARFERDQRNRAEQDAAEAARKAEEEARKSANRGKSIKERAAAAQLDKPTKLPPQAGLGRGTRRESMDKAIEQGRAVVEVQVEDTAAKNADKKAVDAVSKAGYLLGLSNENIPVVKAGLAARDRLKAGKYDKPEYRVYGGSRQEGPFYEVTKTEYDYAQSLKNAPSSTSQVASGPAPEAAAPVVPLAERVEAKKKVAEPTIFALLDGKRSFVLGELTKNGEPHKVKLNNKHTSRADWYVDIYTDGKVADSIPFPALSNGPTTASKAADMLLDYLRTDSDAKWEIRLDGEAAPSVSPAPAASPASETAPPKAKRPPKSFRKKVVVTTDVFVEESGRFEQRETDADSALKALDEDVAELERLRKCLGG